MNAYYKGQKVYCGNQQGTVLRMFGANAVQVQTVREKLMLEGFPARPVGTCKMSVKESWAVSRIATEPAQITSAYPGRSLDDRQVAGMEVQS